MQIDPRFQRKVMYHSIRADALPAFRKLSAAQAQSLLEKLDRWLAASTTRDTTRAVDEGSAVSGRRGHLLLRGAAAPADTLEKD